MDKIVLKTIATDGQPLEAIFLPNMGLTLESYKKGDVEVIDQKTKKKFDTEREGLGVMIGPQYRKKKPYPNGIAKFAPWQVVHEGTKLKGRLTGKDDWNSEPLSKLEGQNFMMTFEADLTPKGLMIDMAIVSDKDSLVGLDYHYTLPKGEGKVLSQVRDHTYIEIDLNKDIDAVFRPFPDPCEGLIILQTPEFKLVTKYSCQSEENSWILKYHKETPYVKISPVSSQDPEKPNLTVSQLSICLTIE